MKYITAQPDRIKFYWQLRVQLANFEDVGIDLSDVHVLVGCDVGGPSKEMLSLRDTGAKVFFYNYEKDYRYLSSVRPHILKRHFELYPELAQEYFFYLDSDVIFRRLPRYNWLRLDGKRWFVSDTRSYIGAHYLINAGGPEVFMDMCAVVGIDPFEVQRRESQSGGCQYILTGTDAAFWDKVEKDSIALWESHPKWQGDRWTGTTKYTALGERPIQIWCADMWAVLWNAWLRGYDTHVHKELDFAWANSSLEHYEQCPLLHMAGVTEAVQTGPTAPHFDKARYDRAIPFGDDFSWVNPLSASTKYIEYFKRFTDGH